MERINTYERFLEKEGIPVIRGFSVFDPMSVPLKPWPRKGGLGTYVLLSGSEVTTDAYVCEIPPGGSLLPQKHLYEELIYILSGYGASTVWVEGTRKHTFEWQEGSLFAPPLNAWHQHFNGQSDKPVRYIGATRAPASMNLFHDLDFIFNNNHIFGNRYSAEEDYFSKKGKAFTHGKLSILDTNFIQNCNEIELRQWSERGAGNRTVFIELSNNVHSVHISQFPVGTYKKAHRHNNPGARLLILEGCGYTLIWPSEGGKREKIEWQKHTLIGFPNQWFHQHFNTGAEPAKYMAFQGGRALKYYGIVVDVETHGGVDKSVKLGGNQIEYEDEGPEIRRQFKEELAKNKAPWGMSQYFPGE